MGDKYKGSTSFIVKKPSVGAYILAFDLGNPESFDDIFKTYDKRGEEETRRGVGLRREEEEVNKMSSS